MRCADCREALHAYLDDELLQDERESIAGHLADCDACAREWEALSATSRAIRSNLVRHPVPDVLRARIRAALIDADAAIDAEGPASKPRPKPARSRWLSAVGLAAAGVLIAVLSSTLTVATLHRTPSPIANDVLASHVRSLMPGHLTDVASSNQHNVKPWFNGRVDFSPAVPNLDSVGFPLVGGRLDYVGGRVVSVVVYARRQHIINVFAWPTATAGGGATASVVTDRGYHLVHWTEPGTDVWAVSDLNPGELEQFVGRYRAAILGGQR
jgi:anti-sigma factor RsiW